MCVRVHACMCVCVSSVIFSDVSKLEDFSRLQTVVYAVKVVISHRMMQNFYSFWIESDIMRLAVV